MPLGVFPNSNSSLFKMGHSVPLEWRKRFSEKQKGKKKAYKDPVKRGLNISKAKKGIPHLNQRKEKCHLWKGGKPRCGICNKELSAYTYKHCSEHKGESQKREKCWNWRGGISKDPYPKEFTRGLKLKIRTRDNFICCLCGRTEREELEELSQVLSVNHIDFDKNNCGEYNLNTLCLRCNIRVNREREYWKNYFQNDVAWIRQILEKQQKAIK